jgi:hypothetical protein
MRKIVFFALLSFCFSETYAQGIADALRYSSEGVNGTARFTAMSGAFGALGGDLSAININPAGSSVLLTSMATLSLSVENTQNQANYFNTQTQNKVSDFNFNQAGIVFVFDSYDESSLFKKFVFGINYQVTNNFENTFFASGRSNMSIDQYFLGYANGVPLDLLQTQQGESVSSLYRFLGQNYGFGHQQAFLGYQGYIFDPVNPDNLNNTAYTSNIAPGTFDQDYAYYGSGFNSKYNVNVSTQVGDDWYFGMNFNSYLIDYRETTQFLENNNNQGSLVNRVFFENTLAVLGSGFSAQFGVITKAVDNMRFGLAYDTPTWFRISEETIQYLETRRLEDGVNVTQVVRPNVINIYEDYRLRSPGKLTASAAYLFGASGLLSLDYSYRDFSNMQFRPAGDPFFNDQNMLIDERMSAVNTVRVGGEYRWRQLRFRGGFQYEESPFRNKELMSDLTGFSLGLGYNLGSANIDFAYMRTEQKRDHELLGGAFTNTANINAVNDVFLLTLGFSL